jgi:rhodanese-related sulfurtransferase
MPATETANLSPALSRRQVLGLAVVGAGVAAVSYRIVDFRPAYGGDSLTVQQAHAQAVAGKITLIDIRRPDEWRKTGVGEGANPIDMRRKDFIEALTSVAGPDRTAPIALMCARGVRSARMSKRLAKAGYTNIIDVPEGMLGSAAGPGWLASDLPVRGWEGPDK